MIGTSILRVLKYIRAYTEPKSVAISTYKTPAGKCARPNSKPDSDIVAALPNFHLPIISKITF